MSGNSSTIAGHQGHYHHHDYNTSSQTTNGSFWPNDTYPSWDDYWEDYGDGDNSTQSSSMPWSLKYGWISIFTLMLVAAAVGNVLVAWIVLGWYFLFSNRLIGNWIACKVNLSLADLTMSLFNCIFNFTFMLNNHWPFGALYCAVNNFIANVTVTASVFTLVAISFDRYIAVVLPLRQRTSKSLARITICLIWLASCCLAIPCLLYSKTWSHRSVHNEVIISCLMIWPDGLPNVSRQDFIYNIIFTVLTYLIPVSVMAICYTRMSFILWRSPATGDQLPRYEDSIQAKRKVVRMFIVVVLLFAVCWLPYHGYFVYQYIDRDVISYRYTRHIYLAFYWLAMSNAMINPFIYYYMNPSFGQYFKTVILRCLCRRTCSDTVVGNSNRVRQNAMKNDQHPTRTVPRQKPIRDGIQRRTVLMLSWCRENLHWARPRKRQPHKPTVVRFNERQMVTFHHLTRHMNPLLPQMAHHPSRQPSTSNSDRVEGLGNGLKVLSSHRST